MRLPSRAKPRVPCERAMKTDSEKSVKSDPAFCLGPIIEKTKSENINYIHTSMYKQTI